MALRSDLIRLASTLPKGSRERKALLKVLASTKQAQKEESYKALNRMYPKIGDAFRVALKNAEECRRAIEAADKFVAVALDEIGNKTDAMYQAAKASGDPYATDDDPEYQALSDVYRAVESLNQLLEQEVKGRYTSTSRIKSLIDELEGIVQVMP